MVSLVFWALEIVLSVFFLCLGIYWILFDEIWVGAVLIAGSLVLGGAAVIMASASRGVLGLKEPMIEMGPEGLTDRRISSQPIPWDSLEWRIMFTGKSHSLVFDVDHAMAERLKPKFSAKAMALLGRMMGLPAYTVMTLGSFKSVHEIAAMMARFKPPST